MIKGHRARYAWKGLWLTAALSLMPASVLADTCQSEGSCVNLGVTVQKSVPNNQVVVDYTVSASGPRADALRRKVNRSMARISHHLSSVSGVTYMTTGRNLHRMHHRNPKSGRDVTTGWRLTQTGEVYSGRIKQAPHWIALITRDGGRITGIHMRLSPAAISNAIASLEMRGIERFRDRAHHAIRALGVGYYRIMDLHISPVTNQPRPIRMAAIAHSITRHHDAPKPVLNAGKTRIRVRVSGTIRVPSRQYANTANHS